MKEFVRVLAEIDENGKKTPKVITFRDKEFMIDRILDVTNRASMKAGGVVERYTIRICGKTTYLYYEFNKWYVEGK